MFDKYMTSLIPAIADFQEMLTFWIINQYTISTVIKHNKRMESDYPGPKDQPSPQAMAEQARLFDRFMNLSPQLPSSFPSYLAHWAVALSKGDF